MARCAIGNFLREDHRREVIDALAKPMIWYGVWPIMLGRLAPRWILWTMTLKSTVLPVSGSLDCGWWHNTHWLGLVQRPPCPLRVRWHVLHAPSLTTSRVAIAPPSGRADSVARAIVWASLVVRTASAATVCVALSTRPVSGAATSYAYRPFVTSMVRSTPEDSAAAWTALADVIGLVWTRVV